jgi:hypothetical protein
MMAVVILVSVLSGALLTRLLTRRPQPAPGSIVLPPPGPNFELYTRIKEIFDSVAQERDEARAEGARLRTQVVELEAERDRALSKLRSATDVLKGWTHPRMDFSFNTYTGNGGGVVRG